MKLEYHTHGNHGPVLVLLHGLLGSGSNWGSLARQLAGQARVLAPDLRNHGASPHDGDMSYDAMAADLLELLDELELPRVHLLGHSMGGKAAMTFACRWPERVDRLLLADITEREFGEQEHRWIFDALQALEPDRLHSPRDADRALRHAVSQPELRAFLATTLERNPEGPGLRFRVNLPVLSREYGRIRGLTPLDGVFPGPALLVRGGDSDYVTEEDLPRMRRWFPRLELETVAGAGHWLHADQPAAFRELCVRFYGLEGTGRA
jgi:esterase